LWVGESIFCAFDSLEDDGTSVVMGEGVFAGAAILRLRLTESEETVKAVR
jgi:hypothetical protein